MWFWLAAAATFYVVFKGTVPTVPGSKMDGEDDRPLLETISGADEYQPEGEGTLPDPAPAKPYDPMTNPFREHGKLVESQDGVGRLPENTQGQRFSGSYDDIMPAEGVSAENEPLGIDDVDDAEDDEDSEGA